MNITNEEYFAISRSLEEHHALFYMAWKMGVPWFDESIPTAAVRFDPEGELIQFVFNPKYWEELNEYERTFVICHECLHVILAHGLRTKDTEDGQRCNIALDIIVNHMLVNSFGFDRSKIRNEKELCWVDTCFPDEKETIPDNKYFEYYYSLVEPSLIAKFIKLVDDHGGLSNPNWDAVIDKLGAGLSEEEKDTIRDLVEKMGESPPGGRGDGTGGMWQYAKVGKVAKKKKWETVIKKWSQKFNKAKFKEVEQWARLNRRFVTLGGDLILPTDMEVEDDYEMKKIQVWFFQDTSGSCSGFRDRFFKAAMSLPENRFDVKMHCFDTQVFETTLESKKLYGFGGTSFHPIEAYIQAYIKKNELQYPEAVFVITDGFGTPVKPEKPAKWYWFLSTNYLSCIPKECNIFQLRDYE